MSADGVQPRSLLQRIRDLPGSSKLAILVGAAASALVGTELPKQKVDTFLTEKIAPAPLPKPPDPKTTVSLFDAISISNPIDDSTLMKGVTSLDSKMLETKRVNVTTPKVESVVTPKVTKVENVVTPVESVVTPVVVAPVVVAPVVVAPAVDAAKVAAFDASAAFLKRTDGVEFNINDAKPIVAQLKVIAEDGGRDARVRSDAYLKMSLIEGRVAQQLGKKGAAHGIDGRDFMIAALREDPSNKDAAKVYAQFATAVADQSGLMRFLIEKALHIKIKTEEESAKGHLDRLGLTGSTEYTQLMHFYDRDH